LQVVDQEDAMSDAQWAQQLLMLAQHLQALNEDQLDALPASAQETIHIATRQLKAELRLDSSA
jgi:hypothetical protein